jgi:hypothetical protein
MMVFNDAQLGVVVTMSEAVYLWQKTRKSIMVRIYKGDLSARQSLLGGVYLISVCSLEKLWGAPVKHELSMAFLKGDDNE